MKANPTISLLASEQVVAWPVEIDDVEVQLAADASLARYQWAAQLAPGADVLDAGCGTGSGTGILVQGGARSVTAVDTDADAVARAAASIPPGGEVLLGDVTDLPFASGSFDVVTCFETIQYIAEPASLIGELRRVLRPGGRLLISSPNPAIHSADREPSVHELPVGVFSRLLRQHFTDVELYRQRSCLGTFLEPLRVPDPSAILGLRSTIHQTAAGILAPAPVVLAVASADGALPDVDPLAVLGAPLELGEWKRLTVERQQHRDNELAELANARAAELGDARVAELERRLDEAQRAINTFESSRLGRIGRLMFQVRTRLRR